jgi:hypothetical protein
MARHDGCDLVTQLCFFGGYRPIFKEARNFGTCQFFRLQVKNHLHWWTR